MNQHLSIFVFCGPSGSGKSELAGKLLSFYPEKLTKWQQVTTRQRRNASDDYLFLDQYQYNQLSEACMLTCQTEIYGNWYGTIPEVTQDGQTVLTIADSKGLQSLIDDVEDHNGQLLEGGLTIGKFGNRIVHLFKVFVYYQVDEHSVERRGRVARGVEAINNEILTFSDVDFDFLVDTTDNWPDTVDFYTNKMLPAIQQLGEEPEDDMREEYRASALAGLEGLRDIINDDTTSTDLLSEINTAVCKFFTITDGQMSDEALVPIPNLEFTDSGLSASTTSYDRLFDVVPDVLDSMVEAVESSTELPENDLSTVVPDVLDSLLESTKLESIATTSDISEDTYHIVETESNNETPVYTPLTKLGAIDAKLKFLDWLSQEAIGPEVFKSEENFRIIFSQYMSANGGNPYDITVSSQTSKDTKGRSIIGFTAHLKNDNSYTVEYNTQLGRPVASFMN